MQSYKELYFYLFGRIADALDSFYAGNAVEGIHQLEQAQIKTEEIVMEMDIIPDEP